MVTIPFGEYLPDQPAIGNPGVLTATNTFPARNGFKPVQEFSAVSASALDARPRGAIQARDKDLNVYQYAGDAAKLYQNVAGTWTDRSKSGGYNTGTDERWEFAVWKNKVLGTNFSDSPQQITPGDAAFSDLTTAFKARHLATVRDFVVFGNTDDSTDGKVPGRVRWSAFGDETDYTVSASTLSDFNDLKASPVERIFGGEYGVVMQRNAIWRMTFTGAFAGQTPIVFQFDEVLPEVGPIAPGAAAQRGDTIYFLSDVGFMELVNGTQERPIGANKVDETVLADLDENHLERVSMVVDPKSKRMVCAYPGSGNTNGRPNKLAVYDRVLDKWSLIEEEVELIWPAGSTGLTLDDLDSISTNLDSFTQSLDNRRWTGGARTLGLFDENFQFGFFDGANNKEATITTGDVEIYGGRRAHLDAFSHLIDGGTVTAEVGTRDSLSDSVTFGASLTETASGRFTTRASGRFHRFRFTLNGAWTDAVGMQFDPADVQAGERRG
ncbi:MAG: hypothetical protein RIB80_04615 [Rhodospirillales bacterium]